MVQIKKLYPNSVRAGTASLLFLFIFAFTAISSAQQSFDVYGKDMDAEIVPRMSPELAEAAITTTDGYVDLLLNDDFLIIQFSDKKLDKIANDISNSDIDSDEAHFVAVLRSMISGGVRTLLDRGLAIPLYEISEISFANGRLIILNQDQDEIFYDLEIDDKPLMEQFSRRDARRFIGEVERRMI